MPARFDMTEEDALWRGDDIPYPIILNEKDEDGNVTGPYNLAGKTIVFTLKLDYTVDDADADLYYSFAVPADQGVINSHVILLSKDKTSLLELATYTYQVKVLDADYETTLIYGRWPCKDS
jgi:hypothetical protein